MPKADFQVFRLDCRGIERALGSLETRIMEVLWQHGPAGSRQVRDLLGDDLAFNTVMTVLNRLVAKGLVRRTGRRRLYRYEALYTYDELCRHLSRQVSRGLLEDFGATAVDQMIDVLKELNPGRLEEIKAALEEPNHSRKGVS